MSPSSDWMTPQQRAFSRIHDAAVRAVRTQYPKAEEFRLVRDQGNPVGWTFHIGNYPQTTFGWVTLNRTVGKPRHDIRMGARAELKRQGEQA